MMEKWPFPCPAWDGFSLDPVSPFARTEMDSGRSRSRRKFAYTPANIDFSIYMRSQETHDFELWFRDNIRDGVDWFEIDLPMPKDGDGLGTYVCRFREMYSVSKIAPDGWEVEVKLEMQERPL